MKQKIKIFISTLILVLIGIAIYNKCIQSGTPKNRYITVSILELIIYILIPLIIIYYHYKH